jgi:hypothetical protein
MLKVNVVWVKFMNNTAYNIKKFDNSVALNIYVYLLIWNITLSVTIIKHLTIQCKSNIYIFND